MTASRVCRKPRETAGWTSRKHLEKPWFPDMPQNALAKIEIDHSAPVAKIRELMTRLPPQDTDG